ncbi:MULTISPECIES: MFS transporter [unclassified Mesorhizobium]|uniref:MFS transporter n=1 Tax=unclassified Mesorhizobium TaxID=325217 RepID=UPI001FF02970|nr:MULTISPECIES: MFS transporter [unclassified Mesorhizobium]
MSAAYAVALSGTTVMPIVVLSMSKVAGYDEGLATIVASAELAGIGIFGLLTPKLGLKPTWVLAVASLFAVLAGEVASFYLQTPLLLSAARLITGLGEGCVFSLVSMSLASRADAERLWGAINLIGGLAMGLLLFVVSLMPQRQTDAPVFLMLAAFTAIMGPPLLLIFRSRIAVTEATHHSKLAGGKMLAVMVVVLLIYMVQAAQWAVCGYVGERVGLSASQIGLYLAGASLAGFLGAVVPATAQDKAKRLPFVVLGFLIMAASIHFLFNVLTVPVFVVAQVFVNIGFFIVTPFLTGVLTENDPDGSLMSRILVVAIVGATIGTAVAGPIFAASGVSFFGWSCLAPLALAALAATLVFGHLHRTLPAKLDREAVE